MRAPSRTALIVAAALGAFQLGGACGPSPGPDVPEQQDACGSGTAPADGKPAIELGTTRDDGSFAPIAPGETLPIQHGPQGGTHVWGAVRLYSPGGTWVYAFQYTGSNGANGGSSVAVQACANGWTESTFVQVFVYGAEGSQGKLEIDATPDGASVPALHAEVPIAVSN